MSDERCTCPPLDDVFARHVQITTKDECPVHPTPPGLAEVLLPAITAGEMKINAQPLVFSRPRARRS